jgi:Domain of unknown function (DUF4942)
MSHLDKGLIPKKTAEQMVGAYDLAMEKVRQGYTLLDEAQRLLETSFGSYTHHGNFDTVSRTTYWYGDERAKDTCKAIKDHCTRSAWSVILGVLQIEKVASNRRIEKIQDDLENGQLPPLTVDEIFNLLQSMVQNAGEIHQELVEEAFKILRPANRNGYKTNQRYEIGKKVILGWMVEHQWTGGKFRVRYGSRDRVNAVDKAFHLLDGKGIPDGYDLPLATAIETCEGGQGETGYFKFKCYGNQNLHLEFKRPDLVRELNVRCAGKWLRGEE